MVERRIPAPYPARGAAATEFASAAACLSLAALPASADGAFSCTDRNRLLHYVFHGDGNQGRHIYLNNLQVAVLDTYRVNAISVRAKVAGNTAPTEFVFNSDRRMVHVELGGTSTDRPLLRPTGDVACFHPATAPLIGSG